MRPLLVLLLVTLVALVGANSIEDAHEFLDSLELPSLCLEECRPQSDVVVRHACTCVRPTPAFGLYENFTCVSTFDVENLSEQPLLATSSIGPQRLVIEVTRRVETFDPTSETRQAYVVEWRCQGGASSLEVTLRGNNGVVDSTTASGFAVSGASTTALALCDGTRCGAEMRCPVGYRAYSPDIDYTHSVQTSAVRYDQLCVPAQSADLNYLPSMLDPSVNVSANPEALYYEAVCGRFADDPLMPLPSFRIVSGDRQIRLETLRNVMSLVQSELYLGAVENDTDVERRQVRLLMRQCLELSTLSVDEIFATSVIQTAHTSFERFLAARETRGFSRAYARTIVLENNIESFLDQTMFPVASANFRGVYGPSSEIFVAVNFAPTTSLDLISLYHGLIPGTSDYFRVLIFYFAAAGFAPSEFASRRQDYADVLELLTPLLLEWRISVQESVLQAGPIYDVVSGEVINIQQTLFRNYTFAEAQAAAGAFELADFLSEQLEEPAVQRDFSRVKFTTVGGGLAPLQALALLANDSASQRRFDAYVAVVVGVHANFAAQKLLNYLTTTSSSGATARYKTRAETEAAIEERLREAPHQCTPSMPAPLEPVTLPQLKIPRSLSKRDVSLEDGPQTLASPVFSIDGSTAAVLQCASYLVLEPRFAPWVENPLVRKLEEAGYFAHLDDEIIPRILTALRAVLERAHAGGFLSDERFAGEVRRLDYVSIQTRVPISKFPRLDAVPHYNDIGSIALYSRGYHSQAATRSVFDETYRCATSLGVESPFLVNAINFRSSNFILMFPGILIPPNFYGPSIDSDRLNGETGFGSFMVGHEIGHWLSALGPTTLPEGGFRSWMPASDLDRVRLEGTCFRDFYKSAVTRHGVSNDDAVYEEAMADYWGTRLLLEIMNSRHLAENITGAARRAELQRLFIPTSQAFCTRINAFLEENYSATAPHPIPEHRARLGQLLFDEFWEAWGVARPAHIPNCTIMGQ